MQLSGGRGFQAEGTVSAKAQRQEVLLHQRHRKAVSKWAGADLRVKVSWQKGLHPQCLVGRYLFAMV